MGKKVDSIPRAKPPITLVAWPVEDFLMILFTGRLAHRSVVFSDDAISAPTSKPTPIAPNTPYFVKTKPSQFHFDPVIAKVQDLYRC
ncbi:hypothetical protein [Niabella ginsengisoli]|uniref:Uncharacterized protein n=1 Tax=Niabella ginsengisoli TaxID=522298 RepID=A0ABS9SM69_9BACT|nr:hypothetical protein [Niabella ginsengisoli]MCH5599467.1 hypothetical protein [Niabella ginsengisoli]